jgi:hypothetical protein
MKNAVFWDVAPCRSFVNCHVPEDIILLIFTHVTHTIYFDCSSIFLPYHKITTNYIVNSLIRDVKRIFFEMKMREQLSEKMAKYSTGEKLVIKLRPL